MAYIDTRIDLGAEETILLVLREHPFLLIIKLAIWVFAAALPFIVETLFRPYLLGAEPAVMDSFLLLRDMYLLFALLALFMIFGLYHLNVHIVTTNRIIDLDQLGLTKHHTVETHVNRIQDVTAEIRGIWGHIFNYGTVNVMSASDNAKITFENIPNPKKVKRAILDTLYAHTVSPFGAPEN